MKHISRIHFSWPWLLVASFLILSASFLELARRTSLHSLQAEIRGLEGEIKRHKPPAEQYSELHEKLVRRRNQVQEFRSSLNSVQEAAALVRPWAKQWELKIESVETNSEYTRSCIRLEMARANMSEWPRISSWIEGLRELKGVRLTAAKVMADGNPNKREFARICLRVVILSKGTWKLEMEDA